MEEYLFFLLLMTAMGVMFWIVSKYCRTMNRYWEFVAFRSLSVLSAVAALVVFVWCKVDPKGGLPFCADIAKSLSWFLPMFLWVGQCYQNRAASYEAAKRQSAEVSGTDTPQINGEAPFQSPHEDYQKVSKS